MSLLSQSLDRRAPIRVTEYKTGSGVHTFHPKTKSWRAVLLGGGGGAARPPGYTGSFGASAGSASATLYVESELAPDQTSIDYIVGAAGLAGVNQGDNGQAGGFTKLGQFVVNPGQGGLSYGSVDETIGGLVSSEYLKTASFFLSGGSIRSLAGGWGGRASPSIGSSGVPGGAPGYPSAVDYAVASFIRKVQRGFADGGLGSSSACAGGGGGDSTMGKGGRGGDAASSTTSPGIGQDATGYGAGGGAGGGRSNGSSGLSGNGSGGYIMLIEFLD